MTLRRGTLRQVYSPLPNLGQSKGPYHAIGSKGWVPRTVTARVGVLLLGTVFTVGGLSMIPASYVLKQELRNSISLPWLGFLVSFLAVAVVLAIALFAIWYGGRLLSSGFRRLSDQVAKN